jgi:large subunit ribosomal protein L24e
MAECSFCKAKIERGIGKLFINKVGKQFWFCSSKCEKNMLHLKRKPHRTKWVTKKK